MGPRWRGVGDEWGEPALLEPPGGLPRPPGGFCTNSRCLGRPDPGTRSPAPHAPSPGYPHLPRSIGAPSLARPPPTEWAGLGGQGRRGRPLPVPPPRPKPGGLWDPSRGHLAAGAGAAFLPGLGLSLGAGSRRPLPRGRRKAGLEAAAGIPALCLRRPLAGSRAEERAPGPPDLQVAAAGAWEARGCGDPRRVPAGACGPEAGGLSRRCLCGSRAPPSFPAGGTFSPRGLGGFIWKMGAVAASGSDVGKTQGTPRGRSAEPPTTRAHPGCLRHRPGSSDTAVTGSTQAAGGAHTGHLTPLGIGGG